MKNITTFSDRSLPHRVQHFIKIITIGLCLVSFFFLCGKLEAQSLYFEHGPDKTIPHDSIVSIPMIAYGVNDIESMQFTLHWNPHILELIDFSVDTTDGFSIDNIGSTEAFEGRLYFVFVDAVNSVTVSTGDTIMNLNFRVVGRPGDKSMFGVQDYPVQLQAFGDGQFRNFLRSRIDIEVGNPAELGQYYSICAQNGSSNNSHLNFDWFSVQDTFTHLIIESTTNDTIYNEVFQSDTSYSISTQNQNIFNSILLLQDSVIRSDSIVIEGTALINADFETFPASCPQINDGDIYLDGITGGNGPYTVIWPDSSLHYRDYLDVTPGVYDIRIVDMNRCERVFQAEVDGPEATVNEEITNASCSAVSNGRIVVEVSDVPRFSDSTYQFSLNGTSFFNDFRLSTFSLSSGPFTYYIRDSAGCIYEIDTEIGADNEIRIENLEINNPSCANSRDGSISLIGQLESPQNGDFTFTWSSPPFPAIDDSLFVVNDLSAGTYNLTVSHSALPGGCSLLESFEFIAPPLLEINFDSLVDESCFGAFNGLARVNAEGGVPPYTYLWSSGDTSVIADSLGSGKYFITVTDQNDCSQTDSVTIQAGTQIRINSLEVQDVLCHGDSSGSVVFSASLTNNADTPLLYRLSPFQDSLRPVNTGLNIIPNLASDSFNLELITAAGCLLDTPILISQAPPLVVDSFSIGKSNCDSLGTGFIDVSVSGGNGNDYSFQWSNGGDSSFIDSLNAGNYELSVTDQNGCILVEDFNVVNKTGPEIINISITDLSCFNDSSGVISYDIEEGEAPIKSVIWSSGDTSNILVNLAAGTYQVTITDTNNCSFIDSYELSEPRPLALDMSSIPDTANNNVGSAMASASGGTRPYEYIWSTTPPQSDSIATNLSSGTYTVTITDSNFCTVTDSIFVDLVTSQQTVEWSSVQVFPNPSSGQFNIHLPNLANIKRITITDNLGRVIKEIPQHLYAERIKTQLSSSGTYYLVVLYQNNRQLVKPIVIQQ